VLHVKTLLFLNGPLGVQKGIEDGFKSLLESGEISELKWFYFEDCERRHSPDACAREMLNLCRDFLPDMIFLFHPGKTRLTESLFAVMKDISSRPLLVYDEHDMYGGWVKPVSSAMKAAMLCADAVSICGLGNWRREVSRYCSRIFFTPNVADIVDFVDTPKPISERTQKLVFIGNRQVSRLGCLLPRLPGAHGREHFLKSIATHFSEDLAIFGNGWKGIPGSRGPVEFDRQMDVLHNAMVSISYEHYPEIPCFFSNRLPIALLSGCLYIAHRHAGYNDIFPDNDFIFFFDKTPEAVDIAHYIFSLSNEDLQARSDRAKQFAERYLTPRVVWGNLFRQCRTMRIGQGGTGELKLES
jgi:hypothetical protein